MMLRVGLLGCTGAVGQQFIRLLRGHAQFDLVVVAASDRSAGQALSAVCGWKLASASGCDGVPREFESLIVQQCQPDEFVKAGVRLVFSALSADVANEVEPQFVAAGIAVFRCVRAMLLLVRSFVRSLDWLVRYCWLARL